MDCHSHLNTLEKTDRSVLLHDLACSVPEVSVFDCFSEGAHAFSCLHEQVKIFRLYLYLLEGFILPSEDVADVDFVTTVVGTALGVEFGFDDIERCGGNGGDSSSYSTAKVVF